MTAEKWIINLLESIDESADEITKKQILEKCGKKCPFSHMPDDKLVELRKEFQSEEEFLNQLCERWRLKRENNEFYIIFDQCYCPLVNNDTQNTSETMCFCTLGSLKYKFSTSLGREINVEMQKTILAGDDECRFKICI